MHMQKIQVQKSMVPDMKWEFEKQHLENRSPAEIIRTLIESGQIKGAHGEWKVSHQGELLNNENPLSHQVDLRAPEMRLQIHPIVAGAFVY